MNKMNMPALVLIVILATNYERKTAGFNALFDGPPKTMSYKCMWKASTPDVNCQRQAKTAIHRLKIKIILYALNVVT